MNCLVCGGRLELLPEVVLTGLHGGVTIQLHQRCATHLAHNVLASYHAARADPPPAMIATPLERSGLTARELGVLQRLAGGDTNLGIAGELGLTPKTVKNLVSSILAKLEAASRTEAAVIALRMGLVESSEL